MTKNFVCHTPYFKQHTSYDCCFWYTCVKWWHLQGLFLLFQNFDFLGVKRQKMAQWSYSISQKLYIIWLWFLMHICTMMISSAILSFFQNYDFSGFYSVKGQKMTQNYQFQSVLLFIAGTVDHIEIFGTPL